MEAVPILVVDDGAANRKLARLLLEREGYEVVTAKDAETALELLGAFRPRLILMDIRLPGIDGLTLTRRLKADVVTKDIVIIALSADAQHGDEERARVAGCDGYVAKPLEIPALVAMVASLLAAQQAGS
jgi:CheY-like chemotaxis protein